MLIIINAHCIHEFSSKSSHHSIRRLTAGPVTHFSMSFALIGSTAYHSSQHEINSHNFVINI